MDLLSTVDLIGFGAGFLVLTTFYLKTMIPLRTVAIFSNVAFISYGLAVGAIPILVLHTLLLPLNTVRLLQMKRLIGRIVKTARGEMSMSLLVPYMKTELRAAGATLFAKGEAAHTMYYILAGQVRVVELDVLLNAGSIVGEMGLFSADGRRTNTVICETAVELASITEPKIWELFYQNPEFGAYLLRTIVQRVAQRH